MESGAVGCSKQGLKPGLPPLRAVVVEVRPATPRWLRPGNASCGSNVPAFFLELGENLPRQIRRRGVRADPGFRLPELLALWEQRLPDVVVAQLSQPVQRILRSDLQWTTTEVPDTDVAELQYQALNWPRPRRLVPIRHRVREDDSRGGKRLLDVPGNLFQALRTRGWPVATHSPAGGVA